MRHTPRPAKAWLPAFTAVVEFSFLGYMSDNVDLRWLSCVGSDERKTFPKRVVEDLTALIFSMMFCSGRNSTWMSTIRINFD